MTPPPKTAFQRSDYWVLGIAGILLLVWNVISWGFPFFWDTVLNSKTASWYLESGFTKLIVPERLDAGHPPFFSLYLAGTWQLLGRSLPVSHAAMLPWLALLLVQFHTLTMRWLSPKGRIWAMALLFCEPTFLAQASMVAPDIALVACYLWALNMLLDDRRSWMALAMAMMASLSFRGILMLGTLFATDVIHGYAKGVRRPVFLKGWPYAMVGLLAASWLGVHWSAAGWLFSPPPETYGGHREVLGIAGMARNVALIGWRLMDFGRVFLWVFLAFGVWAIGPRDMLRNVALRQALIAAVALIGGLALLFVPFANPPGHRYFLVGYLLMLILAVGCLEKMEWRLKWKVGLMAVTLGLVTGHFWIYPVGVAQGWDSSMAHQPIFSLVADTRAYLETEHIPADQVCADFPFLHSPKETLLEENFSGLWFRNYLESSDCEWVLFSNVNNGFSDAQIAEFGDPSKWVLKREVDARGLFIRLLHRR